MGLNSTSAYNVEESNKLYDADGQISTLPGTDMRQFAEVFLKDFSQELRLSSSADTRLRWLIGANYIDQGRRSDDRIYWSGAAPFPWTV